MSVSFKARLQQARVLLAPGIYDALSALIAEQSGFEALYLSGASIAYTRLGRSDVGLTTATEVADTLARITERVSVPVIVDAEGKLLEGATDGNLCITESWPGQMRTVWGDHERFFQTFFSTYPGKYFTGDGCRRDEDGYYWITGRVDEGLLIRRRVGDFGPTRHVLCGR